MERDLMPVRVLLVSSEERRDVLAGVLEEHPRFEQDYCSPTEVPEGGPWDLAVLDGELFSRGPLALPLARDVLPSIPMRVIAGGQSKANARPPTPARADEGFHEGRRLEALSLRQRIEQMVDALLTEIAQGRAALSPEVLAEIETSFHGVESPVAAARISGARKAVVVLKAELEGLFEAELETIERLRPRAGARV